MPILRMACVARSMMATSLMRDIFEKLKEDGIVNNFKMEAK
jgi:hypothetical protein